MSGLTLMVFCASGSVAAQGRTSALVVGVADARTGEPVANAEVSIADMRRSARTNARGAARLLDVPNGKHIIQVRALGYAPSELESVLVGDSVGPVFMLHRLPIPLDPVRVASSAPAQLQEFELRRLSHIGGYFITASELAAAHGSSLADVVAYRIPGVSAQLSIDRRIAVYSRRGPGSVMGGPCQVAVFLNGVRLIDGDAGIVPLSELAGVEYYPPGFAPAQYRVSAPLQGRQAGTIGGSSVCGVILLWTRTH